MLILSPFRSGHSFSFLCFIGADTEKRGLNLSHVSRKGGRPMVFQTIIIIILIIIIVSIIIIIIIIYLTRLLTKF